MTIILDCCISLKIWLVVGVALGAVDICQFLLKCLHLDNFQKKVSEICVKYSFVHISSDVVFSKILKEINDTSYESHADFHWYKNCSECQKQFLYTTCSPQF